MRHAADASEDESMESQTKSGTPIIFFPALGCDARLGRRHHDLSCPIRWAQWMPCLDGDDFDSYAAKVAATIEIPEDCFFAGTSLGGLIALNLARRFKPRGVILIGSMRSSAGVAPLMKWLAKNLLPRVPDHKVHLDWVPRWIVKNRFGLSWGPHADLLLDMIRSHRGSDLRHLCRIALSVRDPIEPGCPVLSIHGTQDRTLSCFEDETDVPLHGAGHFISLTHPAEVNEAIRNFVDMVESELWREGLYHTLLANRLPKIA
jgi:pimeloyl-ACP methyl ester carboxylesterase